VANKSETVQATRGLSAERVVFQCHHLTQQQWQLCQRPGLGGRMELPTTTNHRHLLKQQSLQTTSTTTTNNTTTTAAALLATGPWRAYRNSDSYEQRQLLKQLQQILLQLLRVKKK